ncbi:hypothetical protein RM543_10480 [Roseicyclus sp. F158]|uniref:Uncharacterized protein n=1 Tax=Tropicimonas omnivorans TaxID=3075590 RepID=A0ABU3DHT1_9RHOB|nr:hypothetical protein [Roseicyclus sp. F158]MDT0683113.1 hypothetical protein [Roseicyclus sp. F158]
MASIRSRAYVRFLSDKVRDLLQTYYRKGYAGHHADLLAALDAGDKPPFARRWRPTSARPAIF